MGAAVPSGYLRPALKRPIGARASADRERLTLCRLTGQRDLTGRIPLTPTFQVSTYLIPLSGVVSAQ